VHTLEVRNVIRKCAARGVGQPMPEGESWGRGARLLCCLLLA
jgi:hypothetical protein